MNSDNRKGEIAELKNQLRQLAGSRAPGVAEVKRELYKRVISYVTIGVDVSSLFSEMVMCSATADLVLKKMCYLYVCTYASTNPDLSLLTVNFLQKDCQDDDPMIRGLALRSLCGLRVKNLVEYLLSPIRKGLSDGNPYVRSNAVMGVLKLYHIAPASCRENEFTNNLKNMLMRDPDPQVVINCVNALQEIFNCEVNVNIPNAMHEKESLTSKPIIYSLLNKIKTFSEWGQCTVLEIVTQYIIHDHDEIFDIMNLLEDRLQHSNSAIVLSTSKVFLHLTLSMADIHQQVYERVKSPLLTLISTSHTETSFSALCHLHLLVNRAPIIFSSEYKNFYCKFNDPTYVKKLKIEMLTAVADENNSYDIVNELCEYATDVNVIIARESIRAVGEIALREQNLNGIIDRILQFLEMDCDYITSETLLLVKDILRKFPEWSEDCISVIGGVIHRHVSETHAQCALIWILGEYGASVSDAPYVLEDFVNEWTQDLDAEVKLELLTAIAKLFFKRPPECQRILGKALANGIADYDQDVHDRSLFYYRLFQSGIEYSEKVINSPKQAVSIFVNLNSGEAKDRIFDEFNSLSVVFQKPSYLFLDKEHRGPLDISDASSLSTSATLPFPQDLATAQQIYSEKDTLLSGTEQENTRATAVNRPAVTQPFQQPSKPTRTPPDQSLSQSQTKVIAQPAFVPDLLSDSLLPPLQTSPLPSLAATEPASLGSSTASEPSPFASPSPASSAISSLDDLLGLGMSSMPSPSPALFQLVAKPTLDAPTFQRKWAQLPVSTTLDKKLSAKAVSALSTPASLVRHLSSCHVQCIASGGRSPSLKFFFYAQLAADVAAGNSSFFLVELLIDTTKATASAKIKAENSEFTSQFVAQLNSALDSFAL